MPATAATTEPEVVVFRREPEVIDEMVRFVVDAFVAVTIVVLAYGIKSALPAGAEKEIVGDAPIA